MPKKNRIIPARAGFTVHVTVRAPQRGIIPARAGFTRYHACNRCRSGDHPRSRGVYADDGDDGSIDAGSSPLARGLLEEQAELNIVDGIIPARAGFTR